METAVKLYSLNYREAKTYAFASLFIVGNILLPQLCHLVPGGGLIWLPIYFFTLIAAYKYGLGVGLLTAVFSPIINSLLFGMPVAAALPVILIKSGLLAISGALTAHYVGKTSLWAILLVVLSYQLVGTAIEWAIVGEFFKAVQDFRIGIPGMILQVAGGYLLLRAIAKL
jgi:hypothetical protein